MNAICLEVWQGFNPGPHMHSLHMFYSIGAFVAPIMAKPFLRAASNNNATSSELFLAGEGVGHLDDELESESEGESQIGILYPLGSAIVWIVCLGGSYFAIDELRAFRRWVYLRYSHGT